MSQSKEDLEKLLLFITELANEDGNEWFRDELSAIASKNTVNSALSEDLLNIINDIKRSKYFLKSVDKLIWVEALNYYKKVKFPDLKIELAIDYKEMRIADKNDDIIEFTRRLVMQLENCTNAICNITNAYKVINDNPNRYKDKFTDLTVGDYSFFNPDSTPKALMRIGIPSKIFFAKQYYGINYSFQDLDEMIKIRNKSSHRGDLTEKEREIVKKANENISERKASFFKCYDAFYKNMIDLKQ